MSLPNPLPDDPKKWDGWRAYNSDNLYERLCLDFDSNPTTEEIEENCRQLLIWWQKKLPLKNQPSNPVASMLRSGMDDAPELLSQARSQLLNPQSKSRVDAVIRSKLKERAQAEFHKYLSFSISGGFLAADAEQKLLELGLEHGLSEEEIGNLIDHELSMAGAVRKIDSQPAEDSDRDRDSRLRHSTSDPDKEFIRFLDLAALDGGDMTDDQRDAFVNMAENLGLDAGDAEDMIDDWIEQKEMALLNTAKKKPVTAQPGSKPVSVASPPKPGAKPEPAQFKQTTKVTRLDVRPDMTSEQEKSKFKPFVTSVGMQMLFVPSGSFLMGEDAAVAAPNEKPAHKVYLTRFFISRFPVTNEQYEQFDPAHRSKRPAWAGADHPVIYVNSLDATRFCEWLSSREGKKFRLPTEAEWEFAARGSDGRAFPWGNMMGSGSLANFADKNTKFAWSERRIDDGFAETSPVGSYPKGSSPIGCMDMSGNVWEWCLDYFSAYSKHEAKDPRGPANGSKRIYRGGSWRSRFANLRSSARSFNAPGYSYNDVGFRIVCETNG